MVQWLPGPLSSREVSGEMGVRRRHAGWERWGENGEEVLLGDGMELEEGPAGGAQFCWNLSLVAQHGDS